MTESEKTKLLDAFGRSVVEMVRDNVLSSYLIPDANFRAVLAREAGFVAGLDATEVSQLQTLLTGIVDRTIHDFLYMLSETRGLKPTMESNDGEVLDLTEFVQDRMGGLQYEIGDVTGWVRRFSKHPPSESTR